MNRLILIACVLLVRISVGDAQVLRTHDFIFDFDSSKMGCASPEDLGTVFFKTLQDGDSVQKLFANQDVFGYMITHAGRKNSDTGLLTVFHKWNEYEEQRNIYVRQLLDNIAANKIDMKNAKLVKVDYSVESIVGQEGKVNASDIEILFSHGAAKYSVLLDDCGQVKGKWFIMTPYILWNGKISPNKQKQPTRQ